MTSSYSYKIYRKWSLILMHKPNVILIYFTTKEKCVFFLQPSPKVMCVID